VSSGNAMDKTTDKTIHIPSYQDKKIPIIKQFFQQMETFLHQRYMAPLSYRDIYRTRKELKIIKLIESRLKKGKYILRVTDKSGIFHVSHARD